MNLLYIVIGLQVADLISTVIALRNPRLKEGNPLLRRLFDRYGVVATLLVVKGAFIGFLWHFRDVVPEWTLYGLIVMYALIVANNIARIVDDKESQ